MEDKARDRYLARMQRVLVYIDAHLDRDLRVEVLSGIACFSRYHFQRQFSALLGISVHRYVQLMRLKRASYRLAFRKADTVTDIALDSGYEGPEAFSRAFRKHAGQSPTAFRADPNWLPWLTATTPLTQVRSLHMKPVFTADDVRIADFPETRVAMMDHRGDPRRIGDTIRRFIDWRRANGLHPSRSATFNIFYDDPDGSSAADYRMALCASIPAGLEPSDEGIVIGSIPGGRCAVLRLIGSGDDLRPAFAFLYGQWLPSSGENMRDYPPFAKRIKFYPDVAEHEAETEVYLPLL